MRGDRLQFSRTFTPHPEATFMADQNNARPNPSGPRGPYDAKPDTNPQQARQELADLEKSGPPSDAIFAAERAALRRAAGGQPS